VYVRCHSGLGNQLYQYAAATELARRRDAQVLVLAAQPIELLVDALGAEHVEEPRQRADPRIPAVFGTGRSGWAATRAFARATGRLSTAIFQVPDQHYDPPSRAVERLAAMKRPVLLHGYFQHPAYGGQSIGTVAQLLLDRRTAFGRRSGVIGAHVRRGDYLSHGWELSEEFYKRALSRIDPDRLCSVLIASDDELAARWLNSQFSKLGWASDIISTPTNSPADDLCELAMCQHFIASNSTLSAWAAFAGDHLWRGSARTVAVPDPWLPPTDVPVPVRPNWVSVQRNVPDDS
jgi:hypothetical protein